MDNRFESNGGTQNIGQGKGSIGQQNNYYAGISEERFEELRDQYAITNSALRSFFKILEEQQVPHSDLDNKLREIAATHKELRQLRKGEVRQAIDAGN
ncbi:hypothetical protein VU04_06390, partial [Desulfobulbus sp. TB]|nr:hypothetical protein [Desulfobulbus sp. TB]